jgi:release factor glutamine methyltransferase
MALNGTLSEIAGRLRKVSDTPELDAQVLLAHVLDRPRSWLLAHPEADLSPARQAALMEALSRLEGGELLPYVLGHWEFFGLDFIVTPDVLIPRPETELLVEHAIGWLQAHSGRRQAADIGTGSGCIAVSLAVHVPDLQLLATDISPAALDVATRNAHKHRVADRIDFVDCDLLPIEDNTGSNQQLPSSVVRHPSSVIRHPSFDLLCANLPYIPTPTLHSLPIHGREPTLALDGGADGLDVIRRLVAMLSQVMAPGGICLLEIEALQGPAVLSLVKNIIPNARVTLHQDLSGKDRLARVEF